MSVKVASLICNKIRAKSWLSRFILIQLRMGLAMPELMPPISRKGDGLKRALFLCEDNFVHSRFCEELFNSLVRDEGLNWQAVSRALSPAAARRPLEPMADSAAAALRAVGAAPVNHRRLPLGVTQFDFETSHIAIAIDAGEARQLLQRHWAEFAPLVVFWSPGAAPHFDALTAAVRQLLERVSGRSGRADPGLPVSPSVRPGASAKLCAQPGTGRNEQRYAKSRQSVGRSAGGSPQPG